MTEREHENEAQVAEFILADDTATTQFAAQLAKAMPPAATPLIVYLQGDLGTGKTSITRGMLRALGEVGPVRSPTYGLEAEYHLAAGRAVHLDLYRLEAPEDLQALALADLLPDSRLWLIEWPERGAARYLPAADLLVALQVLGQGRSVAMRAASPTGAEWIRKIVQDIG